MELGKIFDESEKRDAIHIAIIPARAAETLYPAQRVGLLKLENDHPHATQSETPIGIVDPFLTHPVTKGTLIGICLFPGTVTGMRHEWDHPWLHAPATNPAKTLAENRLREICSDLGISVSEVLGGTHEVVTGDYFHVGEHEHLRDLWYGVRDEFWACLATLGVEVPPENQGGFSCSC